MKDPLHIPSERLVVYHHGKAVFMLNKRLLDRQNCWDMLDVIKELHVQRLNLEEIMQTVKNPEACMPLWTKIQFALQKAWGFPEDVKFHRFWDIKGCACPKMDNDDRYPTGMYVVSTACRIHGIVLPQIEEDGTEL